MSALDELLDEVINTAVRQVHVDAGIAARAELAALRARVAELEKPKTCKTCRFFDKDEDECRNQSVFLCGYRIVEKNFGCIHHEPAHPPAP